MLQINNDPGLICPSKVICLYARNPLQPEAGKPLEENADTRCEDWPLSWILGKRETQGVQGAG